MPLTHSSLKLEALMHVDFVEFARNAELVFDFERPESFSNIYWNTESPKVFQAHFRGFIGILNRFVWSLHQMLESRWGTITSFEWRFKAYNARPWLIAETTPFFVFACVL